MSRQRLVPGLPGVPGLLAAVLAAGCATAVHATSGPTSSPPAWVLSSNGGW